MANPTDIGPLDHRVSIVDKQGKPSPEFQRRWNSNRANTALITGTSFGSGAPTVTPTGDGQKYFDTSVNPYRAYVSYSGAYAPASPIGGTPSAVASDIATVGTATTFMRSDASPAIQKASATQFGVVKVDGLTIQSTGGIISLVGSGGGLTVSGPTSNVNPALRGTSASLYSSAAPLVGFPAGTIAGDFVVVFIESAYNVVTPTGWTAVDNSGHGSTSFGLFTKVVNSTDIAAGGVTISCGGSYDGAWACASFQGATGGVRASASNFSGSSPIVATTSGSPLAGDYELVFGSARAQNSTIVSSDGSVLQSKTATGIDASCALYGHTLSVPGAVSPSVTFSAIDSFTSAGVYVIVIEGGPGVISHAATEIDFSGAGLNLSFTGTIAALSITGSGGGGGGGGGSYTYLGGGTYSAVTEIDFTSLISSTYDDYVIEYYDVVPSVNATDIGVQLSTDNGATWITSGYSFGVYGYGLNTNYSYYSPNLSTNYLMLQRTLNSPQTYSSQGKFEIRGLSGSTYKKMSMSRGVSTKSDGNTYFEEQSSLSPTTSAVNALRIIQGGSATFSGTFRLYGLSTSTGGGGGGTATAYSSTATSTQTYSTTPTTDTVPDSMSITIPASGTARKFSVSFGILTDNSHGMHTALALDGTRFYPASSTRSLGPNTGSDSASYAYGASGIIFPIPGDSAAHTISVVWNAQGSTSALTYYERSITAIQVA